MFRIALACLVAVLVAVPASAACRGRNLIDTLAAETQAGLRAAASLARTAPPPTRFSTTTACPSRGAICAPISRANTSEGPPGG